MLYEMQTTFSKIETQVTLFIFREDNHYTMSASIFMFGFEIVYTLSLLSYWERELIFHIFFSFLFYIWIVSQSNEFVFIIST